MTTKNNIKHLSRRAGFGLSPAEWEQYRQLPVAEAVQRLLATATAKPLPDPGVPEGYTPGKMTPKERNDFRKEQRQLAARYNQEWIMRMASPEHNMLLEKMCLFWHDHFACTINSGTLALRYLNVLRTNALGNFRDLLLGVARTPAMIRFLNNQQNKKQKPNENFARELMELFTLGRGQYSEQDVKEAARAFTGWSSSPLGTFAFRKRQHDYGEKTFLGRTGSFDGDEVIDIILEQPATAAFVCGKLYAYFVNERVNPQHVTELADTFRSSNYNIAAVMEQMLTAAWFYAPENVGNRIKSPVELLAGIMRQLGVSGLPTRGVVGIQRALGQQLFRPPNVAGWPGGQSWIDNSTLLTRMNLAAGLMLASDFDLKLPDDLESANRGRLKQLKATLDLVPLRALAERAETRVQALTDYLLSASPTGQGLPADGDPDLLTLRLLSTPEYQLC